MKLEFRAPIPIRLESAHNYRSFESTQIFMCLQFSIPIAGAVAHRIMPEQCARRLPVGKTVAGRVQGARRL